MTTLEAEWEDDGSDCWFWNSICSAKTSSSKSSSHCNKKEGTRTAKIQPQRSFRAWTVTNADTLNSIGFMKFELLRVHCS